jgi:hypothetical protein
MAPERQTDGTGDGLPSDSDADEGADVLDAAFDELFCSVQWVDENGDDVEWKGCVPRWGRDPITRWMVAPQPRHYRRNVRCCTCLFFIFLTDDGNTRKLGAKRGDDKGLRSAVCSRRPAAVARRVLQDGVEGRRTALKTFAMHFSDDCAGMIGGIAAARQQLGKLNGRHENSILLGI